MSPTPRVATIAARVSAAVAAAAAVNFESFYNAFALSVELDA